MWPTLVKCVADRDCRGLSVVAVQHELVSEHFSDTNDALDEAAAAVVEMKKKAVKIVSAHVRWRLWKDAHLAVRKKKKTVAKMKRMKQQERSLPKL